jgi:hypothetical protein
MKIMTLVSCIVVFGLLGCASKGTNNASTSIDQIKESKTGTTANIAGSGSGTLVIKAVSFAADSAAPSAVKNECDLPGRLAAAIKTNAASQYATILEGTTAPPNADVLSIEILNLIGTGGGAWSGGKSLMIKGTLWKQGKAVSDFKALRVSGGGYFGGYMGTCAILGRCAKTLGKDVAGWLQNPTTNATLGDM